MAVCAIVAAAGCVALGDNGGSSSSGNTVVVSCNGEAVVGICEAGEACIEYVGSWSVSNAQADCATQTGATFSQGGACSRSGVYGACAITNSGGGGLGYFYTPGEAAQEGACANASGTWCPITPTDAGGDAEAPDASQSGDGAILIDEASIDAAPGDGASADAGES
jgi:hypothetical protein